MYSGFEITTKEETIVLSHLKNVKESYYNEYLFLFFKKIYSLLIPLFYLLNNCYLKEK